MVFFCFKLETLGKKKPFQLSMWWFVVICGVPFLIVSLLQVLSPTLQSAFSTSAASPELKNCTGKAQMLLAAWKRATYSKICDLMENWVRSQNMVTPQILQLATLFSRETEWDYKASFWNTRLWNWKKKVGQHWPQLTRLLHVTSTFGRLKKLCHSSQGILVSSLGKKQGCTMAVTFSLWLSKANLVKAL